MIHKKWGPGNPLYDWKMKHGARAAHRRVRKAHPRRHAYRGGSVPRQRFRHRRGSRGMGGFLTHGLAPKIGSGVVALGAAGVLGYIGGIISDRLPQILPYQRLAAGTVAGGVPGLIGSLIGSGGSGSYGGY